MNLKKSIEGYFWKFEGRKRKGETLWLKYNQKNHQTYTNELKELFKKNHVSEILGSCVSIWVLSSSPLKYVSLLCITPGRPYYYNVWYSLKPEMVTVPEWCCHCLRLSELFRVFCASVWILSCFFVNLCEELPWNFCGHLHRIYRLLLVLWSPLHYNMNPTDPWSWKPFPSLSIFKFFLWCFIVSTVGFFFTSFGGLGKIVVK